MYIGPATYDINENIGTKQIRSSHHTSASYSFCKSRKDAEDKKLSTLKELRKNYIPLDTPSPARYSAEVIQVKPKPPSFGIPQANRFRSPGEFYLPKTNV